MHAVFEYVPLIIFFVVNKFADIYWATGSLIITSALQILYYFIKKEKVPTRNWIFFGLIAVFGGLTIFLHDESFIKWKVTIINEFFALALLVSYYGFGKNIIKQFLSESLTLPEPIWVKLNLAWAVFFAFLGALNLYVAFNYELETWVNFKVFGLTAITLIFAVGSIFSLYKYLPKEEEEVVEALEDSIEITSNVMSENPHHSSANDNDKTNT
ncbi:septation protein A [Colwellia sp. KU-HH00111]|uniref:septation protein A n=1 Tax=Colwellia sp. KU-HH00111 TaxID=3127652 RepID=UPI0031049B2B